MVWTPVGERMPDEGRRVAVWAPTGVIPRYNGMDQYNVAFWFRASWHCPLGCGIPAKDVTHWSELPEGPR
jgi:hypothetical protein